jgi:hypothetical protein
MGYVIAGVLVILIIAGFITFLVMNTMKKNDLSDAGDPGADQNPLSIIGSDESTPLGDTSEHADEHPTEGSPRFDRADTARPVVGGEAEGERSAR